MVGIRDGFDGLLHPDRYPEGGLVPLSPAADREPGSGRRRPPGQASRVDPLHVRRVDADEMIEEVDMSDVLLERLKSAEVDAVISVVGGRGMSILFKLHRKGLNAVCVPRSIENEIAATAVSFGFNSALSFTIEMLDRVRQAARAARRIAVVEVLGAEAGWLALQAGIAVGADAVLIPEIPLRPEGCGGEIEGKVTPGGPTGSSWWLRERPSSPNRELRSSRPRSRLHCRRWRPVRPATTSSSDPATPPRSRRIGCN
ncbi:MAG: 6-phosphofructokinase [Blastocatellia bacterium]|nr:6-phosphofructokinase [Blastocatellia bacterium]